MTKTAKSRRAAKLEPSVRLIDRPSARALLPAALLIAMTLLAYAPAFAAGFIWDDPDYIVHNELLRTLGGLWRMWTEPTALPQWYPLVHTTFWIEYHIWGPRAPGYHTVNIALHAAGAVLLWRVLRRLAVPGAWLAAALFALHPVHVESVAWITERKNTLSAFFYFAAALAYLRWLEAPHVHAGLPRMCWYAFSLLLFAAALFSKTVACSLPAAVLVVLWWKRGRIHWRDALPLLPMLVMGLILSGITAYIERTHVGASGASWTFAASSGGELVARSLIAGRALWFYAVKLAWPYPLAFMYARWHIDLTRAWQYLFPACVLGIMLSLWLMRRRAGRGPLAAVLFFVGTLFPALGYFNIYPMRFSFVADHFQHLASVGLTTLAAAGIEQVCRRWPRYRAGLIAATLLPLAALTLWQCTIYRNPETLWIDTLSKTKDSWMVYTNLARVLEGEGRALEGFPYYERALELAPELHDTHQNVAEGRMLQGRLDEAELEFRKAIAIPPPFAPAYVGLAKLEFFHRHNPAAAEKYYQQALAISPTYAPAHYGYGVLLEQKGKLDDAAKHYRAAAANFGDDFDTQYDLGSVLIKLHRPNEAIAPLREAARIDPRSRRAWINLRAAYQMSGRTEEANEMVREALGRDGQR